MTSNVLKIRRLCLTGLFLSIGWILPLFTGQIQLIGNMLCPMHIPVYLSGFILGPIYGLIIGFILPLTRTLIFGMPVLYPSSLCMAFELAMYGFFSGFLYRILNKMLSDKKLASIYVSLLLSMVVGRVVWGIAMYLCNLVIKNAFTWTLFVGGAFVNAWPGIIIQLILIPVVIRALEKSHMIEKFTSRRDKNEEGFVRD